jgi:hypothetical protein
MPLWIFPPMAFLFGDLVLTRTHPTIAQVLFFVLVAPCFFWSFFRAWAPVMPGEMSVRMGFLLVFAPFLPLFAATGFFLKVIAPGILR